MQFVIITEICKAVITPVFIFNSFYFSNFPKHNLSELLTIFSISITFNNFISYLTAYCRNPIDGCWYLFDDTKVVPVQESSIITADAYILFYHRSSLSSALSSCASSSTSGYSSSASSYYSDHWAFRMPPFNYWSPKSSKSQDNLSSDTINGKKKLIVFLEKT